MRTTTTIPARTQPTIIGIRSLAGFPLSHILSSWKVLAVTFTLNASTLNLENVTLAEKWGVGFLVVVVFTVVVVFFVVVVVVVIFLFSDKFATLRLKSTFALRLNFNDPLFVVVVVVVVVVE